MRYLFKRNQKVECQSIEKPIQERSSPKHAVEEAYKHECGISSRIYKIADTALQEKDFTTYLFLQSFIKKQLEKEEEIHDLMKRMNMVEKESVSGPLV